MGKNNLIKLLQCLIIIPMYYIIGKNNIFLYAMSLSLYNIFASSFIHITSKEILKKVYYNYTKFKIFKLLSLIISVCSIIFLLLSLIISDIISISLNINDTFLVFLFMGISIITEPLIKLILEYLESFNYKKISSYLLTAFYIIDQILLIIIGLFVFRIFHINNNIAVSLLYLSKIISFITIAVITYIFLKRMKIDNIRKREEVRIDYKKEIKNILLNDRERSIIEIIKNTYFYISIIVLYLVLSSRYSYSIDEIQEEITFMYFYSLILVDYIITIISRVIKGLNKNKTKNEYIFLIFKTMLTTSIIFGMISPLTCKILFNSNSNSIYLMMLNFMAIFIALYNQTFEYIISKKIIYISLLTGLIIKIILIVPSINSFYRMGYNLAYGDISSTMIGMFTSIAINYIYIKNKYQEPFNYLDKILKVFYENILLCIILVIFQFIIPIKTENYFKSLCLIVVYLSLSIMIVKLRNKKRG